MREEDQSLITWGARLSVFHVLVIVLSFVLTLSAWYFSVQQIKTRNQARFEVSRDQAVALISDRMHRYEVALWAGVAAIQSRGGEISHSEWQKYAKFLDFDHRYPGINGMGVIDFVSEQDFDSYLAEQRLVRPEFRVFPSHEGLYRLPITYIEPEDVNAAAVGLDVAHEENRRSAVLAARDLGVAQITGPIVLVQDAGKTPGFLFYAPIYGDGDLSRIAGRHKHFLGAVYAPFVVHKLMEGLLAKEFREVRFSIRDDGEMIYDEHGENKIYEGGHKSHGKYDTLNDPDPMFSETFSLSIYGRTWIIDMRTNLSFREANSVNKPIWILLAGLLIEAMIIFFFIRMSQATKVEEQISMELQQERTKLLTSNWELHKKNDELERFAYVASHDLKTPLRGISGLTEMIQEDLEGYFISPDANLDVATNLERVHERVRRMESLTAGIMEISKVDAKSSENDPINLKDAVNELKFDFGLEEELQLSCGEIVITQDTSNFRSVLENLVGNAIKYHSGSGPIRVKVSAEVNGDTITTSVSDNGPGIDPEYHNRIFHVFQTLGTSGEVESTGIGLSIVKKAVERHGGKVTLKSSVGEGAVFSFEWPNSTQAEDAEKFGLAV